MSTTKAQREAAINAAYDVATHLAERLLDADTLDVVRASLDSAIEVAEGRHGSDLDAHIADKMIEVFGTVHGPDNPLWQLQVEVAQRVVDRGGLSRDELRHALLLEEARTGPWADIGDERPALPSSAKMGEATEPWEIGDEAVVPALSEPLADEQSTPKVEMPAPTIEPESGDDEVIDAEIVEVEQTTSAQRRYRAPVGAYGPSSFTNPALSRSISGRRGPVVEISTGSPDLGDQR